jgi:hypothetical protein
MNIAQYMLVTVLLFAGIICGYVLSFFVEEELKHSRRLLLMLQKFCILFIALVLISNQVYSFGTAVLIIALIVFYFLAEYLIFFAFGILFFVASFYYQAFIWVAILIFVYSVIYGLLNRKQSPNELLKTSAIFFLSSFVTALFYYLFH